LGEKKKSAGDAVFGVSCPGAKQGAALSQLSLRRASIGANHLRIPQAARGC
jgi:hypothetical protein